MTTVQGDDLPELAGGNVQEQNTIVLAPDRVLDLVHRNIQRGGVLIALSDLEWGIMAALLASRRPLSTNDLLEQVWHDRYGDPRHAWAVIGRLRRKIEPDPRHPCVVRRNGSFGYWLVLCESQVGESAPVLAEQPIGGAQ